MVVKEDLEDQGGASISMLSQRQEWAVMEAA